MSSIGQLKKNRKLFLSCQFLTDLNMNLLVSSSILLPLIVAVAAGHAFPDIDINQRFVYDLTWPINQILNHENAQYLRVVEMALKMSPIYLYKTDIRKHSFSAITNVTRLVDKVHNATKFRSDPPVILLSFWETFNDMWIDDTSTFFDFTQEEIVHAVKMFGPVYGIVFNWEFPKVGCSKSVFKNLHLSREKRLRQIFENQHVENNTAPMVKIGFAYDASHLQCHNSKMIGTLRHTNFLLLSTEINVEIGVHHAQNLFENHVADVTKTSRDLIRKISLQPDDVRIVRQFKLDNMTTTTSTGSDEIRWRNEVLLYKLTKYWTTKANEFGVVLDIFNSEVVSNISLFRNVETEEFSKGTVIPFVRQRGSGEGYPVKTAMCVVGSMATTVLIDVGVLKEMLTQNYSHSCDRLLNLPKLQESNLNVWIHLSEINFTLDLHNFYFLNTKWSLAGVILTSNYSTTLGGPPTLLLPLPKKNISVGCEVEGILLLEDLTHQGLVSQTRNKCARVFQHSKVFLWEVRIDLEEWKTTGYHVKYYEHNIVKKLSIVAEGIKRFEVMFSPKKIFTKFDIVGEHSSSNFYCDLVTQSINELYEAIMNWCYLHDIPVVLKDVLLDKSAAPTGSQWWVPVKTEETLEKVSTKFPLLVRRNSPPNLDGFYRWKPDPCVPSPSRIISKNASRIYFDSDHNGATITMKLRGEPLSIHEFRAILHLTLMKFSTVEVIPGGKHDEDTLVNALSSKFLDILSNHSITNKVLFLQLPISSNIPHLLEQVRNTLDKENNTCLKLGGVHLSNYEDTVDKTKIIQNLLENNVTKNLSIGIVLSRCDAHVTSLNLNGGTIRNLTLSHFLCSLPSENIVERWNQTELEKYLDGHLYMAHTFRKFFPNMQTYFRVSFASPLYDSQSKTLLNNRVWNFLQIINTTCQFANKNELKYFVVKSLAPLHTSSSNGWSSGWWLVNDYSVLAHPSVYYEVESVFLKQNISQWRPPIDYFNHSEEIIETIMAIVLLGVIFPLMLIGCSSCIRCCVRRKVQVLSRKETREFFNGAEGDGGDSYSNLKFDRAYEIPKREMNLQSASILGMGNFGIIYQSVVRGAQVAVKIPNDRCSNQSFKGMLIEAKILCFIGCHPNLVEFMGCHTKEIGEGRIYIVTGLCENGSLQDYLRRKGKEREGAGRPVSLEEMIQFSYEIACGMEYIANIKVVHGDLSTRNVLLDSNSTCRIGDFGLSRKLYEYNMYVKSSQEPLPWRWMACESLKKMEFTTKSDAWSYGVTLWEIFSLGDVPYPGLQWTVEFADELGNGLRMSKPEFSSEETYQVMLNCWNKDSDTRPTFTELMDFFRNQRNELYEIL